MTGGRGPDACIDAVGMEAHGAHLDDCYDKVKTDGVHGDRSRQRLRQAIHCCRKGGTVSIPGVYGGFIDKMPIGAAFNKGLTLKMGQTHVHRYLPPLLAPHRERRHRSVVRDHAPAAAGRGAANVPDVPRQEGRLHQGRDEASLGSRVRKGSGHR